MKYFSFFICISSFLSASCRYPLPIEARKCIEYQGKYYNNKNYKTWKKLVSGEKIEVSSFCHKKSNQYGKITAKLAGLSHSSKKVDFFLKQISGLFYDNYKDFLERECYRVPEYINNYQETKEQCIINLDNMMKRFLPKHLFTHLEKRAFYFGRGQTVQFKIIYNYAIFIDVKTDQVIHYQITIPKSKSITCQPYSPANRLIRFFL